MDKVSIHIHVVFIDPPKVRIPPGIDGMNHDDADSTLDTASCQHPQGLNLDAGADEAFDAMHTTGENDQMFIVLRGECRDVDRQRLALRADRFDQMGIQASTTSSGQLDEFVATGEVVSWPPA